MTLRTLQDWIIALGALAAALLAIGALLRFVVVNPLKNWITDQVRVVLEDRIAALERRLDDHIAHHPGPAAANRPRRSA